MAQQPTPTVSFNYLGQLDIVLADESIFKGAPENKGATQSPLTRRTHFFDVIGYVVNHQLQFDWVYSPSLHDEITVKQLGEHFLEALQRLVTLCLEAPGGFTRSDFPLSGLAQPDLDALAQSLPDPLAVENIYPLSPLQQGLLFHSLLEPKGGLYVEQVSFTVADVDWEAFLYAWQTTLNQSPILRTSFHWQGLAMPQQVVYRHLDLPVAMLPASAGDSDPAWLALLQTDRQRQLYVGTRRCCA